MPSHAIEAKIAASFRMTRSPDSASPPSPAAAKSISRSFARTGAHAELSIGEHGRLTPDEARSQAKIILGAVETGADPIADRRTARAVRTFREVANDWMSQHEKPKRKPRTASEYQRILNSHVFPAIGSKRICELRRADLTRLHARMAATPRAANHMLATISAIWNWAARHEEVVFAANPVRGIERYAENASLGFLPPVRCARMRTCNWIT